MKKTRKFLKSFLRSIFEGSNSRLLDSIYTDETIDYISDLLSDNEISDEEKFESIEGLLELHLNPEVFEQSDEFSESTKKAVNELIETFKKIDQEEEDTEEEEFETQECSTTAEEEKNTIAKGSLTQQKKREELDERTKSSIIKNYGKVLENEDEGTKQGTKKSSKLINLSSSSSNSNKNFKNDDYGDDGEVTTELLNQQLKLLDLKKKHRKKIESRMNNDPLLTPNLNSALVDHQKKLKKEELSIRAKSKSEKDKADLIKQRENQLKKKVEARARAQKLERKA